MLLDRILPVKREEVEYRRSCKPLRDLRAQAKDAPPVRDFHGAVRRGGPGQCGQAASLRSQEFTLQSEGLTTQADRRHPPQTGQPGPSRILAAPAEGKESSPAPVNLIAEIKKASPSRGLIRRDFHPEAIARACEQGGARALSVLTDEVFFQGHPDDLARAREASRLPLLRKEFIISDYQVYESRILGADAVLLIVAILAPSQLEEYLGLAAELGLDALVEVHAASEAILAPAIGASLVGINNRDLNSFKTDLVTTFSLLPLIPPGTTVVSESGIRTHEQLLRLGEAGVDAVLVGESLMEQEDIAAAARALLEGDAGDGEG